jgi:hypothetical protein
MDTSWILGLVRLRSQQRRNVQVSERGDRHKDWNHKGGAQRAADAIGLRAERAKKLLSASKKTASIVGASPLLRPGVKKPTTIRYATHSEPNSWITADNGQGVVDAILQTVEDGDDRVILAWPERLNGGFVAAALAIRNARSSGRLAHATFALWPWRLGSGYRATKIRANPADLVTAAQTVANELEASPPWAHRDLAHEAVKMVELRLSDLQKKSVQKEHWIVRSPTLFETTVVFPPEPEQAANTYVSNEGQVLKRVRTYTHLGDADSAMARHINPVGDPNRTPFGLFGIPASTKAAYMRRVLSFERFVKHGLDVVVVDLTASGEKDLPSDWERDLATLLSVMATMPGRRPGIVAITETPGVLRRVSNALKAHAQSIHPNRKFPRELGVYLPEPGYLGPKNAPPENLPVVDFQADIKDASLIPLRKALIELGKDVRSNTGGHFRSGPSRALSFLRRIASLPIGFAEARQIVDMVYDEDDEHGSLIRAMFRPNEELSGLQSLGLLAPHSAHQAERLAVQIEAKVSAWHAETPVSAKLTGILDKAPESASDLLVAFPDKRTAEIFMLSDRAQRWRCRVTYTEDLISSLGTYQAKDLIVVAPKPDIIRLLLTSPLIPQRVILIGDASGTALPLAARASALRRALEKGGGNERLDIEEAEYRIGDFTSAEKSDFTKSNGQWTGDVVRIRTLRDTFDYRPNGDVLIHSPGDLRPFDIIQAKKVSKGDFILALKKDMREGLRIAMSFATRHQMELQTYHSAISRARDATPGTTTAEKADFILARMRETAPSLPDNERWNIRRWLTADQAKALDDGAKQPRAARDLARFQLFARAIDMADDQAQAHWHLAVQPTRSYRVQEGHVFNQRITQFIRDPEGTNLGTNDWDVRSAIWQKIESGVEEVVEVAVIKSKESDNHG